jgi:uncharacterized membrane protein YgcG
MDQFIKAVGIITVVTVMLVLSATQCTFNINVGHRHHKSAVKMEKLKDGRYAYHDDGADIWWYYSTSGDVGVSGGRAPSFIGGTWVRSTTGPQDDEIEEEIETNIEESETGDPDSAVDADSGSDAGDSGDGGGDSGGGDGGSSE